MTPERPHYKAALEALQAAHDACFKNPERDVLGMSHGPFSGVNVALGIVNELEDENRHLRVLLERAVRKLAALGQSTGEAK